MDHGLPVKLDPGNGHISPESFSGGDHGDAVNWVGSSLDSNAAALNPSNGSQSSPRPAPAGSGVIVLPGQGRPGGAQMDMVGLAVALTVTGCRDTPPRPGGAASREWKSHLDEPSVVLQRDIAD